MASDLQGWDDLVERAAEPNPFLESWYLLPSFEQLDNENNASILQVRRNGVLCGLMPVVRRRAYHQWPIANIANWDHPNMFLGTPLVARGEEAFFWRMLLEWADSNTGISLFLHLNDIALDGPVYDAFETVMAEDGRPWAVVERKERALLASELDAPAYLAKSLPARKLKDLGRRKRRLREEGDVRVCRKVGGEGVQRWIEQFLKLEASGWKGEAQSALACDPATETLFRESIAGAAETGRLLRMALLLDEKPIAMLSTFVTPPGAFGFKSAFDEDYAHFSPGFLLEQEFVKAWDELKLDWCDSCAAPGHSVMNRIWSERRPVGSVSIGIGGPLRQAVFNQLLRRETASSYPEVEA